MKRIKSFVVWEYWYMPMIYGSGRESRKSCIHKSLWYSRSEDLSDLILVRDISGAVVAPPISQGKTAKWHGGIHLRGGDRHIKGEIWAPDVRQKGRAAIKGAATSLQGGDRPQMRLQITCIWFIWLYILRSCLIANFILICLNLTSVNCLWEFQKALY